MFTAGGRSVGLGVTTTDGTERAEPFRSVEGRGEEGLRGRRARHSLGIAEGASKKQGRDWTVGRRGEGPNEGTGRRVVELQRHSLCASTSSSAAPFLSVPLRVPMPSVERVSRCWKGSPGPCCQSSPDAGRPGPMLRGRCPPLQGTHGGFVRGATVPDVLSDMAVVVVVVQSRRAARAITRVSEIDSHFDFRALLSFTRSLTLPLAARACCRPPNTPESTTISIRTPCVRSAYIRAFWGTSGRPPVAYTLTKSEANHPPITVPTGLGLAPRISSSLLSSRVQSERNPLY